jgi:hypothetical protein
MIEWHKLQKEDALIIAEIVKRAAKMTPIHDRLTLNMDISAAHIYQPICLEELLKAPDGDFGHDVFGINHHINRETGKLEDGFSPRYSKEQKIS